MSFLEKWKQMGWDLVHSAEKSLSRFDNYRVQAGDKLAMAKKIEILAPSVAVAKLLMESSIPDLASDVDRLITAGSSKRQKVVDELESMKDQLDNLERAKIINFAVEQAKLFWDIPHTKDQDFTLMRSPYPIIYCQIGPEPFLLDSYYDEEHDTFHDNVRLMGAMITELDLKVDGVWNNRLFQTTLFVPLEKYPENTYVSTFIVGQEGINELPRAARASFLQLKNPERADKHFEQRYKEITNWTIHVLNYLTSPSVVLELKEHSPELQKARQKKGKSPLPGWYEISYKKKTYRSSVRDDGEAPTYTHGFRYDVRGHFMTFTKGRMKGRVIWCPKHQRGLANELYKPKTYRVQAVEPPPKIIQYKEAQ